MEPLYYVKPNSWTEGNRISFFNKNLDQYKAADSNLYSFDLILDGVRLSCNFLSKGYSNNRETLDFRIVSALASK